MSWKKSVAAFLADALRLLIRVCLFIDGILLALLSIYVTFRFVFQVGRWLNRVLFSSPW